MILLCDVTQSALSIEFPRSTIGHEAIKCSTKIIIAHHSLGSFDFGEERPVRVAEYCGHVTIGGVDQLPERLLTKTAQKGRAHIRDLNQPPGCDKPFRVVRMQFLLPFRLVTPTDR